MSMPDDVQAERPRKQGMSGTAKVLLVLGSIAGVGLLLCCGGGGYFLYKAKDFISVTMSAPEVKQRTQEIVRIEVPEDFVPIQGVSVDFSKVMTIKYVVYIKGTNTQSLMMLMEMNEAGMVPGSADAKEQRDKMLQAMRQQKTGGNQFNTTITEESSETRKFTVNGKETEFLFVKGTRPGTAAKARQIVGVFPGKQGVVMLMVIVNEDEYDEAAMERMIKSIRLPGASAAAVSGAPDEPADKKPADAEDSDGEEADAEEMKGETEKQPASETP